ncbi:hypothetical protein B0O40_0381 [Ruminococcaceae bacterium R-25]|nr:hypothetical protein B0O40_0381 [Ruminococcaceae bacterium R-25]SUQ11018.1 hypothetical protein SAMN06297423_0381 [Oscillospiraceae bacterium]
MYYYWDTALQNMINFEVKSYKYKVIDSRTY